MANAKVKYILELENKLQLDAIVRKVNEAANGFDGLKSRIETSARSLGLMQRELNTMQAKFDANTARITELQTKLTSMAGATGKEAQEATKLRAELDRLTATNTKLTGQMERKAISIERASANLIELGKQANGTSQSLKGMLGQIEQNTKGIEGLERATKNYNNTVNNTNTNNSKQFNTTNVTNITNTVSAMNGLAGTVTKLAGAYGGLSAVTQLVDWGREGAAIEGIAESFDRLAAKAGTSSGEYLAALKKASTGTINESDLMVGANKAVLLAGDRLAKDVPQLLEIARAAAKATGQDMNFMFDSLVTGLARNSKMIIDNLGITVDISVANERYAQSIGKSVSALNEQERAMAFQAEVMRQGKDMVDAVGVSQDSNADKIARATSIWTDFTNGLKVGAANVVGFFADGISTIDAMINKQFTLAQRLGEINYLAVQSGKSWDEYRAKLETVGLAEDGLAQNQYQVAQALAASGMSAEQATNQVQDLGTRFFEEAQQANLSTEALTTLVQRQYEIAAASPEAAGAVQATNDAFAMGAINADTYSTALETISNETEANTALQGLLADQVSILIGIQEYYTMVAQEQANANLELADSQYENLILSAQMQLQAESERQQQQLLNEAIWGVAAGKYDLGTASLDLAAKLGVSQQKALELINTFTHLYRVLAQGKGGDFIKSVDLAGLGQKAIDNMISDIENAGRNVGKSVGRATGSGIRRAQRPDIYGPDPKKGRGGSGSKGKSEAVKAAEKEQKDLDKAEKSIEQARANHNKKLEDIDRKHSAELIKINADYIQKALAAEQKFNTDKFNVRNGFKKSLIGVDAELAKQALKEQAALWDESQKIAQAGDATRADEYYQAGLNLIQIRTDNAEALAALDAQIAEEKDAKALEQLQFTRDLAAQTYAEEEELARQRLERIKNGQDTLKQERDQAIKDENDDYAKARTEAEQQYADSLQKIIDGYDAVDEATTRTKDAIINMVNTLVPEFARLAQAAVVPTPSGAPASVVEASAGATGRATGGFVRQGQAYRVGEFGSELFVPEVSGTILNQRQLNRALGRGVAAPTLATPRQTTNRTETINRDEVVLNVTGTAREITQAEAVIERIAQRVVDRNAKITVNKVITKRIR